MEREFPTCGAPRSVVRLAERVRTTHPWAKLGRSNYVTFP